MLIANRRLALHWVSTARLSQCTAVSVRHVFHFLSFPSVIPSVSHLVKGWLEERFSGTDRIGRIHDDDVISVVPLQRVDITSSQELSECRQVKYEEKKSHTADKSLVQKSAQRSAQAHVCFACVFVYCLAPTCWSRGIAMQNKTRFHSQTLLPVCLTSLLTNSAASSWTSVRRLSPNADAVQKSKRFDTCTYSKRAKSNYTARHQHRVSNGVSNGTCSLLGTLNEQSRDDQQPVCQNTLVQRSERSLLIRTTHTCRRRQAPQQTRPTHKGHRHDGHRYKYTD